MVFNTPAVLDREVPVRSVKRSELMVKPVVVRFVVVALVEVAFTMVRLVMVEVALFTRMPALKVWSPVHVLALARLSPAITAPVVGEMVRVLSALAVTDDTAPDPTQVLFTLKHPPVRLRPLDEVEVAVFAPVRFRYVAANPPLNVEVELVPVTLRKPARDEVAVEVPVRVVKVRGPVNTPAPVTDNGVPGVVVPMPIFPFPSMVKRVLVPTVVDEEILNLF